MLQSRDFKELLSILEKHEVRYLVIAVKLASGREQDLKDVEAIRRGARIDQFRKTAPSAAPNGGPANRKSRRGRHR